ncbi:pentapeptide repeat-containing protein [Sporomusa termitida]|uniref:Pentapeptide repeats (8 copies) n=1 Tax=Sporomusa termitida TaxID=2377 RepID=A0A517DQE6_9FIRM|nr:pentapeptide repeat-containing protein [Sporomusa termitida]QDR79538.1 Pentapeptide repeats (8 copies) [Sporomusa termitida]
MVKKSAKSKLLSPNLPPKLSLAHNTEFHDEDCVRLSIIQDCTFETQTAENIAIDQVLFKNVDFNHLHWPCAKLTDTVFEQCDLSNVDFGQCFMDRVRLTNCKLVGINMTEASLRNVVFDNCNAAYAVLRYFKCKKSNFHNTSFAEADLYSATLTDVSFVRCNLDKVQFSGTKLAGIDLSTCQFYQLALTADDLRNCIIAPEQAIALANIFGVVIKE